jgi:anti-anti-sigma factor
MEQLTVSVSTTESSVLVSVAGEADMTVGGRLGEALAGLAGARYLVVDLSRLSFIDVACVRVLARGCGAVGDAGGTLVLVAPQPIVARMLELCRADQLIAVFGSMPERLSGPVVPTRKAEVPRPRNGHRYPASAG